MGCLNVQVTNNTVCDIKVNATQKNTTLNVTATSKNTPVNVDAECLNTPIHLNTSCKNTPLKVHTENRNKKLTITISLVCQVSLDKWEYFLVTEGPFIVENGYFKVRKQHL